MCVLVKHMHALVVEQRVQFHEITQCLIELDVFEVEGPAQVVAQGKQSVFCLQSPAGRAKGFTCID